MKRKIHPSPAQSSLAMTTKRCRRSAITALFMAAIVSALALPAFASADPLGSATFYGGMRSTAFVTTNTLGPDGNVWFTDNKFLTNPGFTPAIGRITPSGEIKEYVSGTNLSGLESESNPNAIVAGPGGSKYLWFTDRGSPPAIGVIDSATCISTCTATEFSIEEKGGNPESSPVDIVVGPDGNLWFTDMNEETPAIGKIVLSSENEIKEIKEFSTGLSSFESKPLGIVAGPDGNLWFNDPNEFAPAIGRINPSTHVITEFPTGEGSLPGGGNAENGPWGIAAGPDGNVWFAENGSNETEGRSSTGKAIGRITPSGTITYFSAGLIASSQPTALTAAAGKFWFTDNSGVNEKQEFEIKDSGTLGGTYKLGFEGKETGATGSGNLLSKATGTGDVKRFTTSCKRKAQSKELKSCTTTVGAEVGMRITGTGIPTSEPFAVIENIEGSTIIISRAASSGAETSTAVTAGWIRNVETTTGKFEPGQTIEGTGISTGAIIAVGTVEGKGTITPANVPTTAGTGVALTAKTTTGVTGVTTSTGAFSEGELISGKGIPAGTTIKAINENTKSLELTAEPTEAGTGVELKADLPYNAVGSTIATALKKLSTIGAGSASGSGVNLTSPIERTITFEGTLESTDVEQLSCNGAGLTGTSPSCAVTTALQGIPNAIGCMTVSGEVCGEKVRWPLAGLFAKGFGITPGSDGNLWVSTGTSTRAKIGKFGIEEPPNLKLNVEEGSGTVVSNPSGLECTASAPESCEGAVAKGKVTLTASPAPGYLFKSWKGCEVVNGRQCTITATGSLKEVGAKFYKVFELKGSKSGGLGIMGSAPGGINCGYACTSSTALYKEGALTVKAKPAKHFHFVKFQNGTGSAASCNGVTALECTIATFNSNSAIEEVYAEDAKNTLTLTKEGGGQGFVKTKPTNINCGYTCTAAKAEFYASETEVEVFVTLNKGTTKVNWTTGSGTCTGNALTCTVNMSSAHELVAKFD